jgi:poly(A) polymerase
MTEREFALDVVRKLQAAGYRALWAGGCVRDELLGLAPQDYDVATSARPEQLVPLFRRRNEIGAHFGVVQVIGPRGADREWLTVEVATFRSDGAYVDGRRPDAVTFSTPEEDAQRRDFTVNGMFFDPVRGELIDFVGGRADLDARVLRAIGNPVARFTEDKLRLLRAARMATRFDLTIDPATHTAARQMAATITVVSAERIAEELRKLLTHPNRARGLRLLRELELLEPILPELAACGEWERVVRVVEELGGQPTVSALGDPAPSGGPTPPPPLPLGRVTPPRVPPVTPSGPGRGEKDLRTSVSSDRSQEATPEFTPSLDRRGLQGEPVGGSTFSATGGRRVGLFGAGPSFPLVFAAALHPLATSAVEVIAGRLKLSTVEAVRLCWLVENQGVLLDARAMRASNLKPLLVHPGIAELLALHAAIARAGGSSLEHVEFCERVLRETPPDVLNPPPLITGQDLITMGLKPGPAFKHLLDAVRAAQLEDRITVPEQALALVRHLLAAPPAAPEGPPG